MGDPKHSLSYLCISITVHLSWFTLYKYVCPDSSVCVLLYARVSLSITALDSPSGARDFWSLSVYLVVFPFQLFHSALLMYLWTYVFKLLLYLFFTLWYFVSVLRLCIVVASWTTIYFNFRCELFWYSVSVILWLVLFAPNLFTIYCFELFKSDMCGFIVDLNGPK